MSNIAQDQLDFLPPAGEGVQDDGIDLIALLVTLIAEWRTGFLAFLLVFCVCVAYIYSLKPQYVATATFLPQDAHAQSDTLASLLSNRSSGTLYIGLLRSRSVEDATIDAAHLMQLFKTQSRETARNTLAGKTDIADGADSIITISVRDSSAQNAALIANAYLDGLQDLDTRMAITQTALTRGFFEQQLGQERQELLKAEQALEKIQIKTGLIQPASQTQLSISAIASTRSQIDQYRAQLAGLLQSETNQNPQVQRLHSQIAELEAQESAMEQGRSNPVGAAPPAGEIPQTNLEYLRAEREVTFHESVVTSLSNQFQAARLNEDFTRSAFRVIDRAVVPEQKAWPHRKPLLLFSFGIAAFLGLLAILVKLLYRRIMNDPKGRASFLALGKAFGGR